MTDPEARELLEALEAEVRAVSARRRRLHDRIDFLRGSGVGEPDAAERLAKLEEEEREVSVRRRELHAQIDACRVEYRLGAPGPPPKDGLLER